MLWVGPECNHNCFYKRVAEGKEIQTKEGTMRGWQRQKMWPQAKGCWQPPEAGRGKIQLWSLWKESDLTSTLILAG